MGPRAQTYTFHNRALQLLNLSPFIQPASGFQLIRRGLTRGVFLGAFYQEQVKRDR